MKPSGEPPGSVAGRAPARSSRFIKGDGDWTEYRRLGDVVEVDLHLAEPRSSSDGPPVPYWDKMAAVEEKTLEALQAAQRDGHEFVMFLHGHSTSRPGRTTARSVVRRVMASPSATPFIDRSRSIQHDSVFVAAIRSPGIWRGG